MRSEDGQSGRFTDWKRLIEALSRVGSVAGARKCEAVSQHGKGDREGDAPALLFPASCLFPSGGTAVSESGRPAISAIAAELRDIKDREFWIAARASEAPGGERLNRSRAQAVVTALIGAGVSARRLMAVVGFDDGSQSSSSMPPAFGGGAVIEIVAAPAPLLP